MPLQSSQSLSWSVLNKYDERIPTFLGMMHEHGTPFTLMSGDEVSIPVKENEPLAVALQTKVRAAVLQSFKDGVVARDREGQPHCLTYLGQIHKCARFGGMPSGRSLKRETEQIRVMNGSLVSGVDLILKSTQSTQEIRLSNPTSVGKISGTGKADALITGDGFLRISLKWADSPEHMNQWGGTKHIEQMHPDLWDEWVKSISGWDGAETLIFPLSPDLPALVPTLWGMGQDAVDAILISRSNIVQDPETGLVKCNRVFLRGEIPDEGWSPALVLRRFKGRRCNLGDRILDNARIGVYPLHYRAGRVLSVNRLERGCIYTLPNATEV